MRTIGLIGGMSWESSHEYHRLVNELVRERLGAAHSARLLLWSFDFAEIETLQEAGDWDGAGERLAAAGLALERAGAELLVLCTNTMHRVAPAIEAATSVPLLHIADAVAGAVSAAGLTRVGLLGTAYTMEGPLYPERLGADGVEVLVPELAERELVHRVIYDELVRGVLRESSRERYRAVIAGLVERGAQGVILGCTEIELLISVQDASVPLLPTTRLHAVAAVSAALAR